MFFGVRLGSKRGLIQGIHHVSGIQAVFARYGFDVAIVAGSSKVQSVKDIDGFGVTLFHVPDDHVAADQLIESKHWQTSE
jgi:hypothetical protein